MKRPGQLSRSAGLRRTGPPARRSALTSSASLTRSQPLARTGDLARQSTRRKAEAPARRAVRTDTLTAAGHRCAAIDLVPEVRCSGPLDVDEITPRGVRPGAHLDRAQTQVLCRRHHDWKHAHPIEAHARGLRRWSWEEPMDADTPTTRALHPRAGLRPGAWYACEHPERIPQVGVTAFDPQCGACTLALETYSRVTGRDAHIEQRTPGGVELPTKVSTHNRLRQAADRRNR